MFLILKNRYLRIRVLLARERKGGELLSINDALDRCALGQLKEVERNCFVSVTKESLEALIRAAMECLQST